MLDDLWPLLSLVGLAYLLAPVVSLVLAFRNRAQDCASATCRSRSGNAGSADHRAAGAAAAGY
jgi:hypothetical protein